MGLIKAGIGALGGTLADQWKEFFYCESMPKEVLVTKGQKRVSGRSSNTKGSDNIISNGSGIAVADGQCMIIVEQGKVVEICAEPGEFTYDSSTAIGMAISTLLGFTDIHSALAPDPKSILVFAILWLTHFGYKRIKKTAPSPIIMILFSAALGMLLWGV